MQSSEENQFIVENRKSSSVQIFIKYSLALVRYSLTRISIRMTLSNLGILAVVLAIILPRSVIYVLLYPIFRLVFGNLYPAYASYKAVRTKNVKEYVKWMMYWIVFALFTCAETFTDVFFSFWFPFYYEIKTILVVWLLSPATKGSSILYRRFVHPALIRREAEIDEALARATEQGYTAVLHLGSKGVNYATTVLMQTAIKGGGGLVQHLRKSYSLSDLTGEKEDENRNTPHMRDETDMEVEPRRRENVGRRGYSPRRTQSSSNRVEMYFSEVDVDVRQPRPREPVASLTNIRSSDDISSGYSSGEALQTHRTTQGDSSLVRTSSIGARTRAKPRSTTKKTPEDAGEDSDYIDFPSSKNISFPTPLSLVTPDQALELLLLLSQNSNVNDYIKFDRGFPVIGNYDLGNTSQSGSKTEKDDSDSRESSVDFVDSMPNMEVQAIQKIEIQKVPEDSKIEGINSKSTTDASLGIPEKEQDQAEITDEICQNKFDELKQLLSDTHEAVNRIVYTQDKSNRDDTQKNIFAKVHEVSPKKDVENVTTNDDKPSTENVDDTPLLDAWNNPNVSGSNSDGINRAGKYNKKPAPKVPPTRSEEDLNEIDCEPQSALKATLVIKTGTLKTFSNTVVTKDVFFAHDPNKKSKKSRKQRTKEGFSKLLTIPKNIFHSAFAKEHKESTKAEDSNSEISGSETRSNSIESQEVFIELSPKSNSSQEVNNISTCSTNDDMIDNTDLIAEKMSGTVELHSSPSSIDNAKDINEASVEKENGVQVAKNDAHDSTKDSQGNLSANPESQTDQKTRSSTSIVTDIY